MLELSSSVDVVSESEEEAEDSAEEVGDEDEDAPSILHSRFQSNHCC